MELGDPKFVAVKVDVSSISERYDFKVVVISEVTSTKGVVANILRKIRLKDQPAHAYNLVGRLDGDGYNDSGPSYVVFHEDDHPLSEYSNRPKGTLRFVLQKKPVAKQHTTDSPTDEHAGDSSSTRQAAIDKLRRSLESLRKTTSNVTSTSNGRADAAADAAAFNERISSSQHGSSSHKTTPQGGYRQQQRNHYYYDGVPPEIQHPRLPAVGTWKRSSREPEQGWLEDSGIDVHLAGKDGTHSTATANSSRPVSSPNAREQLPPGKHEEHPTDVNHNTTTAGNGDLEQSRSRYSHSVPTVQDLTFLEQTSLGDPAINRSCVSLSEYKPKRTLPSLSISLEDLQQKKRSLSQILAEKVKDYISVKESGRYSEGVMTPYMAAVDTRRSRDFDDTMSLASLEVANILDDASPESDEDDVDPDGYESSASSNGGNDETGTADSSERSYGPRRSGDSSGEGPGTSSSANDVQQLDVKLPPNPADHPHRHHDQRRDSASEKHGAWDVVAQDLPSENYNGAPLNGVHRHCNGTTTSSAHSPKTRGQIRMGTGHAAYSSPSYMVQNRVEKGYFSFSEEPLTLHAVIQSHELLPVSLTKSSAPSYGIIVYRADFPGTSPYVQHSGPPSHVATWRVTAVLEAVPDTPAFVCGNILPGDVIVEVNGHGVLSTPVEDVRALLDCKHKLQLVIARWRHKQVAVREVWDC